MILVRMLDPLRISLTYRGPSADDGTMSVTDVVSALQGFTGAYGKIATRLTPQTEHRLRVSAVKQGSFEVLLLSMAFLGVDSDGQQVISAAFDAGRRVVKTILGIVEAKKHTKGKPYSINVEGSNNKIVVINSENAKFEVSKEVAEIMHEGIVDTDLGRIVSPLRAKEIDSARISTDNAEGEITAAEVSESERSYFEPTTTSRTITSSKNARIEGYLVSLNKERNRGTFRLQDGTSIPYEYAGTDPYVFHSEFARQGPVRVTCDADFDESLKPSRIRIISFEHLQAELPLYGSNNSPANRTH